MRPDSVFVANFLEGENDYEKTEWVYPDCISYTVASMRTLITEQGLIYCPYVYAHPVSVTWMLIFAPGGE